MKIEDKKQIAEWMGWGKPYFAVQKKCYFETDTEVLDIDDWNPDKDANCWPEIWERITGVDQIRFYEKLLELLKLNGVSTAHTAWKFLTCPLEIRCKALLAVANNEL
jgi:hypothetical protein